MVIKFRCPACRQFLGISATRAGTLTQCPSCHESILVPTPNVAKVQPEVEITHAPEAKTPTPIAEVVDQAAPLPPVEVILNGERSAADVSVPPASGTPAGDATRDVVSVLEKLNSLENQPSTAIIPEPSDTPRRRLGTMGVTLLAVTVTIGGCLVGREFPRTTPEKTAILAVPVGDVALPGQPEPAERFVTGKVTYSDKSDSTRVDAGARVLLLPLTRKGTVKLSGTGFRVGADEVDLQVLAGEAENLGGVCGLANDAGEFRLSVPSTGKYGLLIASHYQPRDTNEPIPPACLKFLEAYFTRPEQMLGNVQMEFREISVDDVAAADRLVHFPQK